MKRSIENYKPGSILKHAGVPVSLGADFMAYAFNEGLSLQYDMSRSYSFFPVLGFLAGGSLAAAELALHNAPGIIVGAGALAGAVAGAFIPIEVGAILGVVGLGVGAVATVGVGALTAFPEAGVTALHFAAKQRQRRRS